MIKCSMSMWFLFKYRVMKISEIYIYIYIYIYVYVISLYCMYLVDPIKYRIGYFFNSFSFIFWKISNLYVKFNKLIYQWAKAEEKNIRKGGEMWEFFFYNALPPAKENMKRRPWPSSFCLLARALKIYSQQVFNTSVFSQNAMHILVQPNPRTKTRFFNSYWTGVVFNRNFAWASSIAYQEKFSGSISQARR